MRALAWILRRYVATVSLAALQIELHDELDQRARCAAAGMAASPQQRPPAELLVILAAAALLFVLLK